ncbi:alpha/beta fold hydrolase [Nocardiopsis sp. HNM0947]|uniref:Alpha/beta fold hydrolase n=1 Tax=Nocardiopsis coralli TaxID=2772213 RepID=A0ABR9P465_9ACTN|nr:alpha/beta fold hydrolase [Nocardiopsis coralli]MBE2998626.1 alpha/beta fold hydrolase [Nocardiopsis coralli]
MNEGTGDFTPTSTTTAPGGSVVQVWSPPSEPRALVQFQHGFGEYGERYVHRYHGLIPHLVGLGFEVWAMDLPGHGHSPGRRGVTDVCEAVREHGDVRARMLERGLPVLLFGHSLGGLVSAGSMLRAPEGVHGIMLTGPAFVPRAPGAVRVSADLVSRVVPHVPVPVRREPASAPDRKQFAQRAAEREPLLYVGKVPMRTGVTTLETASRLWRRVDRWHTPSLVVHGTRDTSTDPRMSVRLVERIPAEDKTMHLVEGGRHELLHAAGGDRIVELLGSWALDHIS